MSKYDDFQPENEEERLWVEQYNYLSKFMSEKLRSLNENLRLPVLRDGNLSDLALMNLYLQALKHEDYETCAVAKIVLEERGFKIPG